MGKKYKKIFISGANGMLGTTLQTIINTEDFLLTDKEISSNIKFCDIRDLKSTTEIINEYNPDIILNFAALVDLEYCEQEKETINIEELRSFTDDNRLLLISESRPCLMRYLIFFPKNEN